MFNVLDFLKKDKVLPQIIYPCGQVNGRLRRNDEHRIEESSDDDDAETGIDYVKEFVEKEDDEYRQKYLDSQIEPIESSMSRLDTITPLPGTSTQDSIKPVNYLEDIFSRYNFVQEQKHQLPIHYVEQRICEMITSEQIIIIQGATGCGKSTQVPQFVLDMCKKKGQYCKIAVTQPRRIAAVTVAKRVCEERGWPLGSVVGYKVGLDGQASEDTILTYVTTGVLLQQLVNAKNMNMYTHIILDEVHERDQDMDFLLLLVKKFTRDPACHTKVILMSATIEAQQFAEYFKKPKIVNDQLLQECFQQVAILDVIKQLDYDVHIFYLDALVQILQNIEKEKLEFDMENAKVHPDLYVMVEKLIEAFDKTDGNIDKPGSVLVFLPGIYEIEDLYEQLNETNKMRSEAQATSNVNKWTIIPLHSSITVEEQKRAFEAPQTGHRKIILSTNIAESSITVPDVVYVIDFCLTKILVCDPLTNYSHLKLTWASHSNCTQRTGRVGRVAVGRVYRFVYQKFYEREMPKRIEPEILRSPLHRLVLLAKMLEMGPPHGILALAMDTPNLNNIKQTVDALKEAGALLLTTTKLNEDNERIATVWDEKDGDLTYVGRIMARLPLDINASRLVIFGHIFGVLNDAVVMAAAMSLQNIFSSPFNERMKAYTSKLTWASGSFSDLIAYLHVYTVWEQQRYTNSTRSNKSEKNWMKTNYLQPKIMREWNILINEIKLRLKRIGVTEMINNPLSGHVTQQEKAMMLKVVICGAFYPNYFVRSSEGGQIDEAMAVRTLGGRDPYTTVYFTGKSTEQPGQLYISKIKDVLSDCANDMHVSFDSGGSGKVYIQFRKGSSNDLRLPGKIASEVYRAVKYRQLKMQTELKCLSVEEGKRRLSLWREEQRCLASGSHFNKQTRTVLPGPEVLHVELLVISIQSPKQFYAQNITDIQSITLVNEITKLLNKDKLDIVDTVKIGDIYAAPFQKLFYRARVTYVYLTGPDNQHDVDVLFIDYGNKEKIHMSQLRKLQPETKEYPSLVVECSLAHIDPALTIDGRPTWTDEACNYFDRLTSDKQLFAKVYSVVDGVCSVELYHRNSSMQNSINNILIQKGYAVQSNESFLSEEDHNMRLHIQSRNRDDITSSEILREADPWTRDHEQNIPAPHDRECRYKMILKGPFSPLEMNIYSMVRCSAATRVSVQWNSVNSVLLDTDPQEEYDRLLVAGSMSTNADKTHLSLRHTTMMPSLRGLPLLMGLIFAPRAVLHTNRTGHRINSVLCGMGYDPETYKARFGQHDIIFNLDFALSADDVKTINEIREYMNLSIDAVKCFLDGETAVFPMETCQTEILHRLKLLLRSPREPLERLQNPIGLSWRHAATQLPNITDNRDVWPVHPTVVLNEPDRAAEMDEIHKHIEQMNDMALNMIPIENNIVCQICNVKLYEVFEIRTHLISKQHTDNAAKYNLGNN